ncbi:hypothetical protein GCM10027570_49670 [Streptomonospora sediminis]
MAAQARRWARPDRGVRGWAGFIPHRRAAGQGLLPACKEAHNASHRQVRARVEHVFARMKSWKILRDCRLKGDGVHQAVLGIARLHNLALSGWTSPAAHPLQRRSRRRPFMGNL